jgi:hypothetical protein
METSEMEKSHLYIHTADSRVGKTMIQVKESFASSFATNCGSLILPDAEASSGMPTADHQLFYSEATTSQASATTKSQALPNLLPLKDKNFKSANHTFSVERDGERETERAVKFSAEKSCASFTKFDSSVQRATPLEGTAQTRKPRLVKSKITQELLSARFPPVKFEPIDIVLPPVKLPELPQASSAADLLSGLDELFENVPKREDVVREALREQEQKNIEQLESFKKRFNDEVRDCAFTIYVDSSWGQSVK